MKKTEIKKRLDSQCREVLRIAAEFVEVPTRTVVDDYTEIVDPLSDLTEYPRKCDITYQESLAAGQTLKILLSYMSKRANKSPVEDVKQTILELIVEASKIYSHIKLNEPEKVTKND